MARAIVNRGSGKAGRACIEELLRHGYEVFNLDTTPPAKERVRFTQVDLTDFGQTIDPLSGIDELYRSVDGVVHSAAIPRPSAYPNAVTFKANTLSTYNVFESPRKLGIKSLVWVDLTRNCSLKFYPGVPLKKKVGPNETLQSIDKARRVLGYDPQYSWRTRASI